MTELPPGYTWQEVPELQAAFPKPDGWFYRYETAPGTQAVFISREQITAERSFVTRQEYIEGVASGKGFRTGLHFNTWDGVSRRLGEPAAVLARAALTRNPLLVAQSRLEEVQDKPLIVYRGYFRSGSRLLASQGMPPLHYYSESVGNSRTDRLYMIAFETPEELWEQDKEIAKVMIENMRLSKEV